MSFRKNAISGFKWSFIETFTSYFFTFIVSIILARILEPDDFGLIAMSTVFASIAKTIVDGGFGDSLIRKIESTEKDYNTIFTFNIILAIFLYILLYYQSPALARYLKQPLLRDIIRVTGISIIISSFSMVQTIILRKQINFKKQTKLKIIASFLGGIICIIMAINGLKYWSLVVPNIFTSVITSVILFRTSNWKPKIQLDFQILKEHFKFGSNIMYSSFVNIVNQNIFNLFVGKYFSASTLGFYYRADNLQKLPTSTLDQVVRHVTYPLLSQIQEDKNELVEKYRILLKYISFLNSTVLIGLAANSEILIKILFGDKWLPSVSYFQLLCLTGIFFPLTSINMNLLNVKGKSNITFLLSLIRFVFNFISIVLAYLYGLNIMIVTLIFTYLFDYLIVSFINQKTIMYSFKQQMKDISMSIIVAGIYGLIIFIFMKMFSIKNQTLEIVIVAILNLIIFIAVNEIFKLTEYKLFKEKVQNFLLKKQI